MTNIVLSTVTIKTLSCIGHFLNNINQAINSESVHLGNKYDKFI